MSNLGISTKNETLQEVFRNGRKYFVPKFQRDYSWDKEQWEDLWEDLIFLYEEKEQYHYMGYLVIQPSSEQRKKLQKIMEKTII